MILKPKDIDILSIKLKKQISVGVNSYNYPITYKDNYLIVQTPIVYIPFDISTYNNRNYLQISFLNCDKDTEMNHFKTFVVETEKTIEKKFKRNKTFISSIKRSNNFVPRLRLSINSDIKVFNGSNELIDHNCIKKKEYGKFLIQAEIVWRANNCFGIIWSILQAKLYLKFKLKEYSFIDDEPVNIDKYKKMVKVGISPIAVKLKMKNDGIDPSLLDNITSSHIPTLPPAPPPPPPPVMPLNSALKINKVTPNKITPDMLTSIKLKKTEVKKLKSKSQSSLKPLIDLKEILSIRNKLKNV